MHFHPDVCPECEADIAGTHESIPGFARMFRQANGSYEYTGSTDVHWDGQMTDKDPKGRALVECVSGHTWYAECSDRH